jgi:hypothetical protein
MVALRPVLVERQPAEIRMASRDEAEEIVDLALEPAGRERARCQRRKPGGRRLDRTSTQARGRSDAGAKA